jgi:hypothetical protein
MMTNQPLPSQANIEKKEGMTNTPPATGGPILDEKIILNESYPGMHSFLGKNTENR